jgi:carbon-monoxide dehydrogenase medium subunit
LFEIHIPRTLEGALELMANLDRVKPLAGGTDLVPLIRDALCTPKNLVDLNRIPELNYIEEKNGFIRIGATVTHSQLASHALIAKIPALLDAVSWIGSPQIRNQGTLAGNILNASPAADSAPPLLIHEGQVTIKSLKETKIIPIAEVFQGPKINCLEPDELLTEIKIPLQTSQASSSFKRIGRRKAFTLSVVSAAAYLEIDKKQCKEARFAFGSVDTTPVRVPKVERMIQEAELDEEKITEACAAVKDYVNPITDIRGTADYRRNMCEVLLKRAIHVVIERLR